MKLIFVALAAVFALSANAQEMPDCEAMYSETLAAANAEHASAGAAYTCFAKDVDMSEIIGKVLKGEEPTQADGEKFVANVINTCSTQIEAMLAVFDPSAIDVVLAFGIDYQMCKAVTAAGQ